MMWESWQPEVALMTREFFLFMWFTLWKKLGGWVHSGGCHLVRYRCTHNSRAWWAARTSSWWFRVISIFCLCDYVEIMFIFSPISDRILKVTLQNFQSSRSITPLVTMVMGSVKTMTMGDSLPPDLLGFYQFNFLKVNLRPEFTHSHMFAKLKKKKTPLTPDI